MTTTASVGRDLPATVAWIAEIVAERLDVAASIPPDQAFTDLGVDSVEAIGLAADLGSRLGLRLTPTALYEYPTARQLAAHIVGRDAGIADDAPAPGRALTAGSPIAIVGIGCRLPGADHPEAFWDLLRNGRDMVGTVPPERAHHWNRGGSQLRHGAFLDQVEDFDAAFFGISPREAASIDPQQRLLLEVAWEALEDAGMRPSLLRGSRTGVFVGITSADYQLFRFADPDDAGADAYACTGANHSIAANRISYLLDLNGPSVAIDTACSASMTAVHLACASLRAGESTLALAGGVNVILSPVVARCFSEAGVLSPDGRCMAFDAAANGYVRGEGAAMVTLKPLARAFADGDRVYAVIRGSAVNNDGRTNGLMAPSRAAQEAVLRVACAAAGVEPAAVSYVEAHGTGTKVGDLIELGALAAVYGEGRPRDRPCWVGSVKSNLGHLEAAAGVTGLIKATLALFHRQRPASLHVSRPTPDFGWGTQGLQVQREHQVWPAEGGPLLAGVSSFGFGGSNAHVVLEAAPAPAAGQAKERPGRAELLLLSARSPSALRELIERWRHLLAEQPPDQPIPSLADLCQTAGARRDHHGHRLAVVGASPQQLAAHLAKSASAGSLPLGGTGPGKLAFVFPDDGEGWSLLGLRSLAQEPAFRSALERCDELLIALADWSLVEQLLAGERVQLRSPDRRQAAHVSVQVALAELWRSWGVEAAAVVGHGAGEIAAAHVAGALTLEDALRIAQARGLVSGVEDAGQSRTRFEEAVDDIYARVTQLPMLSVLTGEPVDGRRLTARHWARQLRAAPGRLDRGVARLAQLDWDTFVRVSPNPMDVASLASSASSGGGDCTVLPVCLPGDDARTAMLRALGALYEQGRELAWQGLFPPGPPCPSLPTYPWDRDRHPLVGFRQSSPRHPAGGSSDPGGLRRLSSPAFGDKDVWEVELPDFGLPDPQAAGWWLELAAMALTEHPGACLADFVLEPPFEVGEGAHTVQLVVTRAGSGSATLEMFSKSSADSRWRRRAACTIRSEPQRPPRAALRNLVASLRQVDRAADEHADTTFRRLWIGEGEALGFGLPQPAAAPAIGAASPLPCGMSVWLHLLGAAGASGTVVGVGTLAVMPGGIPTWVHATVRGAVGRSERLIADLRTLDGAGNVVVWLDGVEFTTSGAVEGTG
jgi:acyl transferase domain-containing protein/acyl carrier protein